MKKRLSLFALLLCTLSFQAMATVVYVDSANTSGTQNGASWATAYVNLSTGIGAAGAGDSVWVAKGTYKPVTNGSYTMKAGVKIFGGFLNTYTTFAQRDWQNNVAILHGNNNIVIVNNANNLTSTAVLDGFTITGGSNSTFLGNGGGMYNYNSSPSISSCTFANNTCASGSSSNSSNGAGMYNSNASPVITNCTFSNNTCSGFGSVSCAGAGMYNGNSSPIISNCNFLNNTTTTSLSSGNCAGGAMANYFSTPTVNNCTFSNNTSISYYPGGSGRSWGGAIYNFASSTIVSGCTFSNNLSSNGGTGPNGGAPITYSYSYGGAIMFNDIASPTISNCTFSNNSTSGGNGYGYGGAIYIATGTSLTINNSTFSNNTSSGYSNLGGGLFIQNVSTKINSCNFVGNKCNSGFGGAIYNSTSGSNNKISNCIFRADSAKIGAGIYNATSSPIISNSLFVQNVADSVGGAVFNAGSSPKIINCTIISNKAPTNGSGMYNIQTSAPQISNTILWGNLNGIYNNASTPIVKYSLIQGMSADAGNHNLDGSIDPLFVSTIDTGNYQLQSTSPCIDIGNNDSIPSGTISDLAGNLRIANVIVDMGGYEFGSTPVPLALHLLSFTGRREANRTNLLQWQMASGEAGVFTLQRSNDGKKYATIYETSTINTKDNTYSFTDATPEARNYYRLVIGDQGGHLDYSNTVFIASDDSNPTCFIYPNPARDAVHINISDAGLLHTQAILADAYGRVVRTVRIESNSQLLSLAGLTQGLFMLKMQNGQILKIVKE
jgi:hypothetical protein